MRMAASDDPPVDIARFPMVQAVDVYPEAELAIITGQGAWSGNDLLESARRVVEHPLFAPPFDWLYDLREIRGVDITPHDMHQNLEQLRAFRDEGLTDWKQSRTVIVTHHPDTFTTGTLHKHMAGHEADSFTIVETMDAAYTWLGLDEKIRPS